MPFLPMLNWESKRAWILAVLTRAFIRIRYTKPEETRELSLLEEPTTVYTFQSDSSFFAQTTLFGTIVWNKTRMDTLSTEAKRLVLRHECSHRDRNPIYKGLFYSTAVSFATGLMLLAFGGYLLVAGAPVYELVRPTLIAVLMIAVFVVLFRVEETMADYHAICELGEEGFLTAYDEIATEGPVSRRGQFFRRIFYTHPQDTARLYRWFHGRLSLPA